jgi:hypothetical protein
LYLSNPNSKFVCKSYPKSCRLKKREEKGERRKEKGERRKEKRREGDSSSFHLI